VRHPTIPFRAEFIGKIQRRQKTQTRRPVRRSKLNDGRRVIRACAFREGQHYQLVSVEDRPFAWSALTDEERIRYGALGFGEDSTIYKTIETALDGEFLRVLRRPHQEALIDISEDDLAVEGFDEREEFIEYMAATYSEHVETVWVVEFEWTIDAPNLLANQAGHMHPEQYVHTAADALPLEPEGVDAETLKHFAGKNRTRFEEQNAGRLAEDEARGLATKLKEVRKRAARTGVNVTLEIAVIKHQLDEIERKADEAA
jgi:hypothetical protein